MLWEIQTNFSDSSDTLSGIIAFDILYRSKRAEEWK